MNMRSALSSLAILALIFLAFPLAARSETYEECVLENIKGANDQRVLMTIKSACREKTLPKKCRKIQNAPVSAVDSPDAGENGIKSDTWLEQLIKKDDPSYRYQAKEEEIENCVAECRTAGLWSRTFGECSP